MMTAPISFCGLQEIYMEITNMCNMNCMFCPSSCISRKKENIDPLLAEKVIKELSGTATNLFFNILGEPLLNSKIFDYLDLAEKYNVRVIFVSNGLLFTRDVLQRLLKYNCIIGYNISFQTISAEDYATRETKITYEQYLNNLKELIFCNERLYTPKTFHISVMYDMHVFHDILWNAFSLEKWNTFLNILESWRDELYESGVYARKTSATDIPEKGLYRNRAAIPSNFIKYHEKIEYEVLPYVWIRLAPFRIWRGDSFINYLEQRCNVVGKLEPKSVPGLCQMAKSSLVVYSSGKIGCCCFDYDGDLEIGHIETMSLAEAATSEFRASVYNTPENHEMCRRCRGDVSFKKK